MNDVLSIFLMTGFGAVILLSLKNRYLRFERPYLWACFAGHVVAAIAQVVITRKYYGGGDMTIYYKCGLALADWAMHDLGRGIWVIVQIALHMDVAPPVYVMGIGGPTGTMSALGGLASMVTFGSLYGICILFGLWAFSGQLAIYNVIREVFPRAYHKRMLIACLLLPSVLYWASALLKESVALGGLGWAVLGIRRLFFTGDTKKGLVLLVVGCTAITLTKPYVLFPLAGCGAIWFYWYRSLKSGEGNMMARIAYLALVVVALIPFVIWLGQIFPQYAVDNVTSEAARLQTTYYGLDSGGSTYVMGSSTTASSDQQLALVPVALTAALFRPFIFEAHNAASLVNAVETFALTIFVIMALYQRGLKGTILMVSRSPFALFCAGFVILFGTAVGLGAPNLGSLSRYRVPMMPLYAALVMILLPLRAAPTRRPSGPAVASDRPQNPTTPSTGRRRRPPGSEPPAG